MSRRVIDCTKVLRHGASDSFTALEFERADEPQTSAHRIEMDADVGTHVLAPRRYARWGSDLAGLSPETFFGEGLVAHLEVSADAPDIDSSRLEDAFGRNLRTRDIVLIAARGDDVSPVLTAQAAQWLFVRGAKLVALADGISIGREQERDDERVILSTLLENDVPVVLGLVNTETLSTERMAFMALPAPAADVTAWPVRFIALDPGLDPTEEIVEVEGPVHQPEPEVDPAEADAVPESAALEESDSDPSAEADETNSEEQAENDQSSEADEPSSDDDPDETNATKRSTEA
ncbi:MAG: cyclase family protein [Chloroflexi bacterium]|nr:cyclase family protein [Chloroflexota bacterium]